MTNVFKLHSIEGNKEEHNRLIGSFQFIEQSIMMGESDLGSVMVGLAELVEIDPWKYTVLYTEWKTKQIQYTRSFITLLEDKDIAGEAAKEELERADEMLAQLKEFTNTVKSDMPAHLRDQ